ncbi:DUF2524 domain-containing protein [Paenibacillus thermoaerophilus]|uniref:DUF2524 domain-containing protein n=1 Tax=Paenibacillus thermoaerophilus TaxID=1215385 RepID=A0ABW2V6H2_9BACL|nr:DUF2524 domain-containing protein [Paenibacillus thermoaerophilus]TMV18773.1 DUF2524 domain-containing protein [Paenibacillus thermoaerophilus]
MTPNDSSYDCANAGDDLHRLKLEIARLRGSGDESPQAQQELNRLENEMAFIRNKCGIH